MKIISTNVIERYAMVKINNGLPTTIKIVNSIHLNPNYNYGDFVLKDFKIYKNKIVGKYIDYQFDFQEEIPDNEIDFICFDKKNVGWFKKRTVLKRKLLWVIMKKSINHSHYNSLGLQIIR